MDFFFAIQNARTDTSIREGVEGTYGVPNRFLSVGILSSAADKSSLASLAR